MIKKQQHLLKNICQVCHEKPVLDTPTGKARINALHKDSKMVCEDCYASWNKFVAEEFKDATKRIRHRFR